jgi:hypothetical protein
MTALVILHFATAPAVLADSELPPQDYAVFAPGDRYVLVMLVPDATLSLFSDDQGQLLEWGMLDETLRAKYAQSGVYEVAETPGLVFAVDWYSRQTYPTSDGRHLVRVGPWPGLRNYEELAVAFYVEGREIRRYRVRDVVQSPELLPESVSHYQWLEVARLDDLHGQFTVDTMAGERVTFDFRTGDILLKETISDSAAATLAPEPTALPTRQPVQPPTVMPTPPPAETQAGLPPSAIYFAAAIAAVLLGSLAILRSRMRRGGPQDARW